ncbi:protein PET100 homolog, mitochondrial isoform X3 [Castor canadensis]|uniref:Protein PET100 homolog, mitochondrial isoform X3 n=1 Tax=Castor canadensis TaxID=51338 RepID=A0AC58KZJ8_CASCN
MGVKLEVFRMALYLTFPVAMFWISNQAEWFEDHVIQRKVHTQPLSYVLSPPSVTLFPQRELWPPEKEGQDEAEPT